MKDAMGGVVNLVIIIVFMVIISGYLAFNVVYTKAFKVKNKIVLTYEEFDGNCGSNTQCSQVIDNYMAEIGYRGSNMTVEDVEAFYGPIGNDCNDQVDSWDSNPGSCIYCPGDRPYCVIRVENQPATASDNHNQKVSYKIITRVQVNIPIINRLLDGMRIFQVTGDTKTITVQ